MSDHYVTDPVHPHLGGNVRGGDPDCACPAVWEWLFDRYAPGAVLDVGCGTGEALRWFAERGSAVVGLDGLAVNAAACGVPAMVHDLTTGPAVFAGVDLVWCCEVVEHVEARFVPNLLDTLCVAPVLAMTFAPPGVGGYHHVNERPAEYWRGLIESRGYRYLADETGMLKERMPAGNFFRRGGLIFEREK